VLRGPGTPWRRMQRARRRLDALIYAEIGDRRASGRRGEDVLSLLLDACDDDRLVRDEVMTLLFAGHDTTTSTVAFLFHELAKLGGDLAPAALEPAIEETLRLYPPAWLGPRRSVREFEFGGYTIPVDMPVNYCSWASHRLPDVWEDPHEFRPERFSPGNRGRIPRGAYVPFGGGSRTCIGMRFGQLEIRVIAREILERFRLLAVPDYKLRIRQTPTLGPRDGLPLRVSAR
jgi:cytochrome P450